MAASVATSAGSYYIPQQSRSTDRTAKYKQYYQASTQGVANDADFTLTAFTLSGTADFMITYVKIGCALCTNTGVYNLLLADETVASMRQADNLAFDQEITFGLDGVRVTGFTSTAPMVQFVASNAAATGSSILLLVQGHYV